MNLFTNLFSINFMAITGQQSWELLAWTMCFFLAAGTVVALAGALVRFLCKRLAPQIRYTVSLAVFATLAMLPFGIALGLSQRMPVASVLNSIVIDLADTPIAAPVLQEPLKLTNITVVETPMPDAVPLVVALARQDDGPMEGRVGDWVIAKLPWVWLVGTPLTFLLLATGLIGSGRLRRQCTLLTEGPIFDACQRLRSTLAVSQRVGIAINERIASPLLIGIVRPLILLPPAALTGWSPDELEMVLLHELAHVRRWDNLVNFGQRLVESLLFFHPAVWWVSRWVRRDREECCDAVVIAQTEKPQAYAELLVALATPPSLSSPPLAGMAMAQHPLAGRIRRILHLEEEKMLITRSTLGLVGFFVVAVLGVVLWQPVTPTTAQEPTNTPVAPGSAGGSAKDKTAEDTVVGEGEYGGPDSDPFRANSSNPIRVIFYQLSERDKGVLLNRLRRLERDLIKENAPLPRRLRETDNAIELQATDHVHALIFQEIYDSSENAGNVTKFITHLRHGIKIAPLGPAHLYYHCFQSKDKRFRPADGIRLMKHADGSISLIEAAYEQIKASNHPSPFPTLEAQRSADLAYKLLDIELEPLNKEELARVKAMKFAGGLRVSHTERSRQGIPSTPSVALPGDLLVGLHVWPTTSLADVKKVLDRDDLQDLSPLKFYVIRKARVPVRDFGGRGDEFGGYGGEEELKTVDQLVTGRIVVNISAMKIMKVKTKAQSQQVRQSLSWPRQSAQQGLGQARRRIDQSVLEPLFPPYSEARIKVVQVYEGKDFSHWQSQWKNELSIKNRTETVRALAAFGNAGHGKEAAKVILEIAGKYDWDRLGDGSIKQLQAACMNAFGKKSIFGEHAFGSFPNTLPHKEAKEALLAAMRSENVRVRAFVEYVLPNFKSLIKIYKEQWETDEELRKYLGPGRTVAPDGVMSSGGTGGGF